MSDPLVDFASLDSAVGTPAVETPTTTEVETPNTDSTVNTTADSTVDATEDTEGKETETKNADGTDKTPEEQAAFKEKTATNAKPTDATPANVRSALKAMRDSDPKNSEVVKQLHGAFERWNAAKAVFPKGVAEMQEAKAFIDSVGGPEGYQKMQEMIDTVTATDELLYAEDPKLWDNVIEDLKANNHPEALGKLAPSFLQKLKAHDSDAFYNTIKPIVSEALTEVDMDTFVSAIY